MFTPSEEQTLWEANRAKSDQCLSKLGLFLWDYSDCCVDQSHCDEQIAQLRHKTAETPKPIWPFNKHTWLPLHKIPHITEASGKQEREAASFQQQKEPLQNGMHQLGLKCTLEKQSTLCYLTELGTLGGDSTGYLNPFFQMIQHF